MAFGKGRNNEREASHKGAFKNTGCQILSILFLHGFNVYGCEYGIFALKAMVEFELITFWLRDRATQSVLDLVVVIPLKVCCIEK